MGRIAAPYGVKGWLRVLPTTAEPQTLLSHAQWFIRGRGRMDWQACALQSGRMHGGALLAQVAGIDDREAAAAFTGGEVGVPRSALPAAGENEFYWSDLVGLAVRNRQEEVLGTVEEVQEFGAHPVLRVTGGAGATLIPWVPAYIDGVDLEARRIDVDWQKDYG
jgi:16S rRNA processing protein RimM